MHELAITQSVVDMVVERMAGRRIAARTAATAVTWSW
jgi:Zn finger protein HypA/HybF involved in hydrogenase expression